MLTVGSLFSGIGGIELGFERTGGFETRWFVENEPYCQAVLRKHWPCVPIYGDIRTIDFTKLPQVDMLTGGFPCQDISNAGKRKGISGERSGLWKEFFRAISEIRPKYAFVENVSALTYRGLLTVLGDLASLGYNAEWHCLSAASIGALHKRERIYILAYSCCTGRWRRKEPENERKEIAFRSFEKTNVAYCNSKSLERRQQKQHIERESKKEIRRRSNTLSNAYNYYYWQQRKKSLFEKNRRETWATDSGVLRVANGIPNRIHRIKCLGNSVVPQCAEFFAEIIKEKEESE